MPLGAEPSDQRDQKTVPLGVVQRPQEARKARVEMRCELRLLIRDQASCQLDRLQTGRRKPGELPAHDVRSFARLGELEDSIVARRRPHLRNGVVAQPPNFLFPLAVVEVLSFDLIPELFDPLAVE